MPGLPNAQRMASPSEAKASGAKQAGSFELIAATRFANKTWPITRHKRQNHQSKESGSCAISVETVGLLVTLNSV